MAHIKNIYTGLFAGLLAASASAQISLNGPFTTQTGQSADGLVFADWNGDGTMDMAVATDGAGNLDLIEVYMGSGTGSFALASSVFLAGGSSPHSLAAADFDGDGDMDMAVSLQNFNQVQMVQNVGNFAFVPGASATAGGSEPRQVTAADMDGDGDPDVVVSLRDSSAIGVIRNQGGAFTLIGATNAGNDVRDHAVGDWDGDGDIDVAASSHDDRTVRVLSNTGGGNLALGATLFVPGATRPSGLAAGDIDGDGDMDLVAAAGDDAVIGLNFASIFTNAGGTFTGPINVMTGGLDADDVVIGDLSGDGSLDMVVSHQNTGTIALLENSGAGTFGVATQFAVAPSVSDMVLADVDGNGGLDLGALTRQAAGVRVFLSDAAGNTEPGSPYCTTNPNSTGQTTRLRATGSATAATNDLVMVLDRMPVGQFGIIVLSQTQGFVMNPGGSNGNLCLGGLFGRMNHTAFISDANGVAFQPIDFLTMPTPFGPVVATAGQTWNFQGYHRDNAAGIGQSNFSNGYTVDLQ